jgi:hypothetical protein
LDIHPNANVAYHFCWETNDLAPNGTYDTDNNQYDNSPNGFDITISPSKPKIAMVQALIGRMI